MKKVFLSFIFFISCINATESIEARIEFVKDGDTMDFSANGAKFTCRVLGIDSPEKYDSNKLKQETKKFNVPISKITNAGKRATAYAKDYFSQNDYYTISFHGKDRYDRHLCMIDDSRGYYNLNAVTNGFAVVFKKGKYIKDGQLKKSLKEAQNDASFKKIGLWLDFNDVMEAMAND